MGERDWSNESLLSNDDGQLQLKQTEKQMFASLQNAEILLSWGCTAARRMYSGGSGEFVWL
jgi:hypothetical protein